MKIVILDAAAANPGDLSWDWLKQYGDLTVYERTPASLVPERAKDAEIVLLNKTVITREAVAQLPKLKFIAILATGFNVVDIAACDERGIAVANIPSYSVSAVAQQTFAFLLEFANRIGLHSDSVHRGDWVRSPDFCYQKAPLTELGGKTIGIKTASSPTWRWTWCGTSLKATRPITTARRNTPPSWGCWAAFRPSSRCWTKKSRWTASPPTSTACSKAPSATTAFRTITPASA